MHVKINHALAFNTLLSSQETDAYIPTKTRTRILVSEAFISFIPLCLNSFSRSSLCQIDSTCSTCGN
jgi:hypothetical protein